MFNPVSFLKLAEDLIKGSTDEAKIRSSISRTYYGTFHLCKNWLESLPGKRYTFQYDASDHIQVQKLLKKEKGRNTKDKFSKARRNRNYADYDLNKEIDKVLAKDQLSLTDEILKKCGIR
ncbi:MAG: hypothetical protein ACC630_07860 [Nitrospinota bacterium]